MGFGGDVLDGKLGEKHSLLIVEDELILRFNVNEMRTHVKRTLEQMGMHLEIIITGVVI